MIILTNYAANIVDARVLHCVIHTMPHGKYVAILCALALAHATVLTFVLCCS